MATEVSKYAVFDPRIVQTKPKYAVEKGALSITNVSFQAQTADASTCQFNVQVPSENVFVDRGIEWRATQCATVVVTVTVPGGDTVPVGTSLQGLVAPGAFPLHQSTTQMTSSINDATVTVNTLDVLPQVLRLADMRDARRQRTCPTMLDRYAVYPDSRVVKNSPLNQWDQTKNSDEVPNGGFNGFYFCTDATFANAQPLGAGTAIGSVGYLNGQPYVATALVAGNNALTFYVAWSSTEKLMLPPYIFADEDELSTGLFGVQNFQVQMNLSPNPNRAVRVAGNATLVTAAGVLANVTNSSSTWASLSQGMFLAKPFLDVQFLTPSLDIPLPPKSIVPYMEFPRYISSSYSVDPSTDIKSLPTQLTSQTITLPNIPDLLVIYAKPSAYANSRNGDWCLPVSSVSLNFDNFSGLLANHTQQELYQMSVHNGVDMDWSEWTGLGAVPLSGAAGPGGNVALVGGPLVLRPGRDFALQSGQASGLVGNFTLQFNLNVRNFTGSAQSVNIYTVPISSGFFETIKGSSRIIKGVLTEQDILGAAPHAPEADLERPVGSAMVRPYGNMAQARDVKGPSRSKHSSMGAYM